MARSSAAPNRDELGLQGSISTLLERVNDAVRGGTPDAAPLAECLHRLLILRDDVDALSEKKAVARQHKTGAARPPSPRLHAAPLAWTRRAPTAPLNFFPSQLSL